MMLRAAWGRQVVQTARSAAGVTVTKLKSFYPTHFQHMDLLAASPGCECPPKHSASAAVSGAPAPPHADVVDAAGTDTG